MPETDTKMANPDRPAEQNEHHISQRDDVQSTVVVAARARHTEFATHMGQHAI